MTPDVRRLVRDLKHRKVFRVAAVYAVVAFMVAQVADIVFPALQLPDWTVSLVVGLALLGFPVALVLAWAYELTPDGVKREEARERAPVAGEEDPGNRRLAAGVGIGVIVALIGFGGVVYFTGSEDAAEEPGGSIRSIAVLPFENLSTDEENAFFAAGMHDEVLTHLGRIAELQVISKTSVLPYAGSPKGMREIGRELGVRAVMEGSVQRYGNQIRVTAVLIDAATDQQLWAERYDRSLEDVFRLQTDIALAIANALEARLTPEERRRVERGAPTEDLEAFRYYVLGTEHLDQRTEESMRRSIPFFERAIARDSSYAAAWAGLADAHTLLHDYGYATAEEVLPQAEAAVARLLELDPEMAYASLAGLHMTRGEFAEAVRHLRRAVEVEPGSANAQSWLSWLALLLGLREEALQAAQAGIGVDPLHAESVSNLAFSLLINGEPEAALTTLRERRISSPEFSTVPFYAGIVLYHLGRFREAIEVLDGPEAEWADEGPRAMLALSHVAAGDTAAARRVLGEIVAAGDHFAAGLVLSALGETGPALDAFQRLDGLTHWPVLALRYLPSHVWAAVQGHAPFEDLLREMERDWTADS